MTESLYDTTRLVIIIVITNTTSVITIIIFTRKYTVEYLNSPSVGIFISGRLDGATEYKIDIGGERILLIFTNIEESNKSLIDGVYVTASLGVVILYSENLLLLPEEYCGITFVT